MYMYMYIYTLGGIEKYTCTQKFALNSPLYMHMYTHTNTRSPLVGVVHTGLLPSDPPHLWGQQDNMKERCSFKADVAPCPRDLSLQSVERETQLYYTRAQQLQTSAPSDQHQRRSDYPTPCSDVHVRVCVSRLACYQLAPHASAGDVYQQLPQ